MKWMLITVMNDSKKPSFTKMNIKKEVWNEASQYQIYETRNTNYGSQYESEIPTLYYENWKKNS